MKIDEFTLFSGSPITYKTLTFNQPKLLEIGKIGEKTFYECISYFLINKNKLSNKISDLKQLEKISNIKFIILLILQDPEILKKMNYIFSITTGKIMIIDSIDESINLKLVGNTKEDCFIVEEEDWSEIISIIKQIFCIAEEVKYNTKKSRMAQMIEEKLKAAREKIDEQKSKGNKLLLGQYCSILSVGSGILVTDIIENYTIYQLMYQLKRFSRYEQYHIQINAMVHGAKIDNLVSWYDSLDESNSSVKNTEDKQTSGIQVNNKNRKN